MKQFEMRYLILFSEDELHQLYNAWSSIEEIVRQAEQRNSMAILDEEVHCGAHFRARQIFAEIERRAKPPREFIEILDE